MKLNDYYFFYCLSIPYMQIACFVQIHPVPFSPAPLLPSLPLFPPNFKCCLSLLTPKHVHGCRAVYWNISWSIYWPPLRVLSSK